MSFGKVSLAGVVTPWLHAFDVPVARNLSGVPSAGIAKAKDDLGWLDHPRFDAAPWDGRVEVARERRRYRRCAITLDRGAPHCVGTDAVDEPVWMGKALRETDTVKVVVVDCAGNRGRAAVRHVKVP